VKELVYFGGILWTEDAGAIPALDVGVFVFLHRRTSRKRIELR